MIGIIAILLGGEDCMYFSPAFDKRKNEDSKMRKSPVERNRETKS